MGAPPHVALLGPGGRRIEAPVSGSLRSTGAVVFHTPKQNTTYFIVRRPAAGRWQIVPLPDSVPVTAVGHGNGLPSPSVHARVAGSRNSRVLRYAVERLPGQTVTFEEHGRDGSGLIGKARGVRGALRFHPATGARERRTIVAVVSSFGKPRTVLAVAHYTSPGLLRPARPKALTLTRQGSTLRVTWKRSHWRPALPPVRAAVRWACAAPASDRPRVTGDHQGGRSAAHGERVSLPGRERHRHDRPARLTPSSAGGAAGSRDGCANESRTARAAPRSAQQLLS